MERTYGESYAELYRRHWWWRSREAFIMRRLRALSPPEGFGPILDIGCGDGLLFDRLEEIGEPEGLETDRELVSRTGRWAERIHVGPVETFRPGRKYGLILLLDVLEHVDDDVDLLRRAASLLEERGRIVVTVPAFQMLWTHHDRYNRHLRRYTRPQLVDRLDQAGLAVDGSLYFFHWLVPVKIVVRVLESLRSNDPGIPGIPPEWMNRLLYGLCRLDHRITLPFGTSVFAQATRG